MRIRILSVLLVMLSVILASCSPEHSKMVIAEYGNEKVTLGEFENVYVKNAGSLEAARKDSLSKLKNFLDLYVNFKLKLRDASIRGFDSNPALQAELTDYKEKVGVSYLIEKEMVEPAIKELYDKRKFELRLSHLMIRPDSMSDAQAKELGLSLLERIKKGESFETLVKQYSSDVYSKDNGGDIYYITAGTIIPEFEDAAYNTEVGKVCPELVKTRYGYHIIKVTDKRERIPQLRASHILIDFINDKGQPDTAAALAKIQDIKAQLQNGADFTQLAVKYSEDPGSKENGGDLGYFERRMMVKEFEEAAFNMKVGQVSDIIKTNYGFHLLKVTDIKPYPSFEEEKENLKKLYKRARYDTDYAKLVKKYEDEYKFTTNKGIVDYIAKNNDSIRVGGQYWECKWRNAVKDSVIYSIAGESVPVDSFFKVLEVNGEFVNRKIDQNLLTSAINKEAENKALKNAALALDKRDPQFASLMDDYKNGIYIFKLQDDEIWSKIQLDSARLYNYYEQTKSQYVWPDRVNFSEIYSANDSLINHYYDLLQKGANFDTLAVKHSERSAPNGKPGEYGFTDPASNPLAKEADKLQTPGSYSKPFKNGTGYSIVRLISRDPSHGKSFEEAKAEVSAQYQDHESKRLESEYITNLRNRYKPVVFNEELEKAFKSN
ncbi:MAG: peptidylprolyl isomerase [Ignavibacteriales bacterium]